MPEEQNNQPNEEGSHEVATAPVERRETVTVSVKELAKMTADLVNSQRTAPVQAPPARKPLEFVPESDADAIVNRIVNEKLQPAMQHFHNEQVRLGVAQEVSRLESKFPDFKDEKIKEAVFKEATATLGLPLEKAYLIVKAGMPAAKLPTKETKPAVGGEKSGLVTSSVKVPIVKTSIRDAALKAAEELGYKIA